MVKFLKKLFKKREKVTVVKYGKTYRFKTFTDAIAFMMG